jgi:ribose transport system permease protein
VTDLAKNFDAATGAEPRIQPWRDATLWRRLFPLLVLAALCVVFASLSPRFLTVGNGMIVLQQGTVLMVAALGMTFIIMAGSIDLSVGSIVAMSALTAASLSAELGAVAILPATLVGIMAGLVNGVIIAKGKVPSFIVTMGTMVIYRGIVLWFTRGAPVSISDESFLVAYADRSLGSRIRC